ncbi:hypothetical protein [Cytobacillus firmus]|uniref:hypothetical protein n=1 Tax=Cytobacillus firmus TaxID=1399 RepID=UPI001C93F5C9|nr:hypothetical protein [Cytobacillus firmus]MBY6054745.1 hypothetical protein [Cytobacillus firmus]
MNYRQLLDNKLEKLDSEIVWGKERKSLIKRKVQEKLISNDRKKRVIPYREWFKVSFSLVVAGVLCVVLITSIFSEKMDFFEFTNAESDNYSWYNMKLEPSITQTDIEWAPFESYLTLVQSYKNFDLEESQKLASFKIMRPNFDLKMPLEISSGVSTSYPPSRPIKDFKGPISYWDIWHKENKWVYSKQSLAENSKHILNAAERKVIWKIRTNAKIILNNKQAIAVLTNEGEDGIWINMQVKNEKAQVTYVQIRGNIDEEELIKLAKSYLD